MRPVFALIVGGLLCAAPLAGRGQDAAPTTSPAAGDVSGLIAKLADPDFHVRRDAATRLRELGPAALPELKEALQGKNPEIRARAGEIVHVLEYQPIPGRPVHRGYVRRRQVNLRIVNGRQSVDVDDEGRKISITEADDGGIEMTVTGETDGKPATQTYKARTPEQLRGDNPEAYAIYQRYAHAAGPDFDNVAGNVFVQPNGNVLIARRFQPATFVIPQGGDDLNGLRRRADDQMDKAKLSPVQRARVESAIDRVEQTRQFDPVAAPIDPEDNNIRRYNRACDELRRTLADLKLDDPGERLPPPKSARLDVSVREDPVAGTVTVVRVLPHSRADNVGLQDDDVIRKINGAKVSGVKELRRLVTENARGLVVEVTRDGRDVKLEEPK